MKPFKNWTFLSGFRMHLKIDNKNVWFSNESGFRRVGFRIPTVVYKSSKTPMPKNNLKIAFHSRIFQNLFNTNQITERFIDI